MKTRSTKEIRTPAFVGREGYLYPSYRAWQVGEILEIVGSSQIFGTSGFKNGMKLAEAILDNLEAINEVAVPENER